MTIPSDDRDRNNRIRRVLLLEGAANLSVLIAKVAVGLTTGSAAILGDAVHSLADLANNGMAFLAMRLASTPPDRGHPYGHRKYEPLAVFALATLLAVTAIEVALRGSERGRREIVTSDWGLGLMFGVVVVNSLVSLWEARWARRLDSDLLRADVRHTASDVGVSLAVIAGWQLGARGFAWLDTLFAFGIAGLILTLSYGLFRRSIPALVDAAAADPERIADVARQVPGVRGTGRVRSAGRGEQARIEVTVHVDAALSTLASHTIADAIERSLGEEFGARDVTVHVEPDRRPGR